MDVKIADRQERLSIGDIPAGTVFSHEGDMYMKVNRNNPNAVGLNSGALIHFIDSSECFGIYDAVVHVRPKIVGDKK